MKIDIIAYRIFGKLVRNQASKMTSLDLDLKKSGLNYTADEWLSVLFLVSTITFIIVSVGLFVIASVLTGNLINAIAVGFFGGLLASAVLGFIIYIYPSQEVNNRKKKIVNSLHFATIYMATLAGTGIAPYKMFDILKKFEEFGEISKIAASISRDMNTFGLNFNEALVRAADNAPEKSLRDLLWGINSTLLSGGNLKNFLQEKAEALTNEYRRILEGYVRTLSLFLEVYITVVIVGSVFVLVLTTIMSLLGGSIEQIKVVQLLLITVGMPFISFVFIFILKQMSPIET